MATVFFAQRSWVDFQLKSASAIRATQYISINNRTCPRWMTRRGAMARLPPPLGSASVKMYTPKHISGYAPAVHATFSNSNLLQTNVTDRRRYSQIDRQHANEIGLCRGEPVQAGDISNNHNDFTAANAKRSNWNVQYAIFSDTVVQCHWI